MPGRLKHQPSGLPQLRLQVATTQAYERFRRGKPWQRLSRAIRRARPVCEACRNDLSAEVHHIQPWLEAPARGLDPTNLQALCRACHHRAHHHNP